MVQKKARTKIVEAAALYHRGLSFERVAEEIGASPNTIHRWSKTDVWEEEIAALEEIDRREVNRVYIEQLRKTRDRLEASGVVAINLSISLLAKIKAIADGIDPSEAETLREKLVAVEKLTKAFEALSNSGKVQWLEASGLSQVTAKMKEISEYKEEKE